MTSAPPGFVASIGPTLPCAAITGGVMSRIVITRVATELTPESLSVAVAVTVKLPGLANVCAWVSGDAVPAAVVTGFVPSPSFTLQVKPAL